MRSFYILLTASLLISVSHGDLQFVDKADASGSSLLQFGNAQSQISLLLTTADPDESVIKSTIIPNNDISASICTSHAVTASQISNTIYNVSAELIFEGWVGDVSYTVSVLTSSKDGKERIYTASGVHSVYGLVLYEIDSSTGARIIVSGDEGAVVHYKSYKNALDSPRKLRAAVHALQKIDLKQARVSVQDDLGSSEMSLLSSSGISFSKEDIFIAPNSYRVGSGQTVVNLELLDISLNGESYETQFIVTMGKIPAPPPVISDEGNIVSSTSSDGGVDFTLRMFNLGSLQVISASVSNGEFLGEIEPATKESSAQIVRFHSETEVLSGTFTPRVYGKLEDGTAVQAVILKEAMVKIVDPSHTENLQGSSTGYSREVTGIIAGLVGFALLLTIAIVVFFAARSRQQSEQAEGGYDDRSLWDDAPAFSVARDVYGRGSVEPV